MKGEMQETHKGEVMSLMTVDAPESMNVELVC